MTAEKRDRAEFQKEMQVQLRLLRKAAHEYDSGDIDEVRNIARALRVIFADDDQRGASLLTNAGMDDTEFKDTSFVPHHMNIAPYSALVCAVLGPVTVGYRAMLDSSPKLRKISLSSWLTDVVIDDKGGEKFNRLRLIKAISNLGGATHYPADVRSYFARLQSMKITAKYRDAKTTHSFHDIEKHSLRQVAHEVIATFDSAYRRSPQFEDGALMITGCEAILYPGKKITKLFSTQAKGANRGVTLAGHESYEILEILNLRVSYEGWGRKRDCICGSGLKFRDCCSISRKFNLSFIDEFEKKHLLGRYEKS